AKAKDNLLNKEAYKTAKQFDLYPVIPKGDLSIEFIENVFSFNPYYVLDALKKHIYYTLLDNSNKDIKGALSKAEKIYLKYETAHKERILNALIDEFRSNLGSMTFIHSSYTSLRINETVILYYAFCIYYISRDIKDRNGLKFSKAALITLKNIICEKSEESYLPIKNSGKMLELPEFRRDKSVYEKLYNMINNEVI
ncbi:MAG: hypothetical protein J5852_02935, partial [Clostridia bacterium]|nr:hypothetical protein [Clostridia bacterium]